MDSKATKKLCGWQMGDVLPCSCGKCYAAALKRMGITAAEAPHV